MSIEFTLEYTDAEYLCAVEEKLASMPNKSLHTYGPTVALVLLMMLLQFFDVLTSWWGITLSVVGAIYALPCLMTDRIMPKIALALARKKKLADVYTFRIDSETIERDSKQGTLTVRWDELSSVDISTSNIFLNLEKGSMLIPVARLNDTELQTLQRYAKQVQ